MLLTNHPYTRPSTDISPIIHLIGDTQSGTESPIDQSVYVEAQHDGPGRSPVDRRPTSPITISMSAVRSVLSTASSVPTTQRYILYNDVLLSWLILHLFIFQSRDFHKSALRRPLLSCRQSQDQTTSLPYCQHWRNQGWWHWFSQSLGFASL